MAKRILIAESNDYLSETLVDLLTKIGFEAVGATSDSDEIIDLIQELQPNLLLIDYDMSQQTDIGIIRAQFPGLKVVAAGFFEVIDGLAEIAKRLGLDGFFCKYSSRDDLLNSINTLST